MISEKYIAINFARKEVEGTAYVAPLRDTRLALPVPLGSDPAPTPPLTALLNAWREHLRGAEQAHGIDMASSDTASHLLAAYDAATATGLRDVERFDQLVEAGRALITRIGNQSNLILDPDLDSYYTMSLVVLRFPELWELLGQNARKIIEISGSDGEQRGRRVTELLVLQGKLDAVTKGIESDYDEAFAAGYAAECANALANPSARRRCRV